MALAASLAAFLLQLLHVLCLLPGGLLPRPPTLLSPCAFCEEEYVTLGDDVCAILRVPTEVAERIRTPPVPACPHPQWERTGSLAPWCGQRNAPSASTSAIFMQVTCPRSQSWCVAEPALTQCFLIPGALAMHSARLSRAQNRSLPSAGVEELGTDRSMSAPPTPVSSVCLCVEHREQCLACSQRSVTKHW